MKWWNNYLDKKLKKRADEAKAEEDKQLKIQQELDDEEKRLSEIAVKARRDKAKKSNKPYIEMIASELTSDGLKFEMDWNGAMIKYLNKAGFKGATEEIIIHKYISEISKHVQYEEIAQNYVEDTGENKRED